MRLLLAKQAAAGGASALRQRAGAYGRPPSGPCAASQTPPWSRPPSEAALRCESGQRGPGGRQQRQRAAGAEAQAAGGSGRRRRQQFGFLCSNAFQRPCAGPGISLGWGPLRSPPHALCARLTGAWRPAAGAARTPGTLGALIIYVGSRPNVDYPLPGPAGCVAERQNGRLLGAASCRLAALQRSWVVLGTPCSPTGRPASAHRPPRWRAPLPAPSMATMRLPRQVHSPSGLDPRPLEARQRLQPTRPVGAEAPDSHERWRAPCA